MTYGAHLQQQRLMEALKGEIQRNNWNSACNDQL